MGDTKHEEVQPPRWRRACSSIVWFLKDQWFIVALALVIVIASQVQVPRSQQEIKETAVSYLSVAVVFLATGCTLPTHMLLENYQRWKLHLFVQGECFLVTSALGYAVVAATATNKHFMDPWLLIGLIINGCLPTTLASNVVMTKQAGGNQALTVVQTTIGNFIGVFFSPLLVRMYLSSDAWYAAVLPAQSGGFGALFRRVLMQLGLTIYVPMVVGQIIRNLFPKQTDKVFIDWKLNKIGSIALLTLVWQTFDRAFETRAFESVPGSNMVFIVFICIANWGVWLVVTFVTSIVWLDRKDTVSACYCVPAKTLAVGVPLSTLLYKNLSLQDEAKLQIPMVIFQAFQVFFGSLLTIPLRKWVSDSEEKELEGVEHAQQLPDKT